LDWLQGSIIFVGETFPRSVVLVEVAAAPVVRRLLQSGYVGLVVPIALDLSRRRHLSIRIL
jgi:hypothetical protein